MYNSLILRPCRIFFSGSSFSLTRTTNALNSVSQAVLWKEALRHDSARQICLTSTQGVLLRGLQSLESFPSTHARSKTFARQIGSKKPCPSPAPPPPEEGKDLTLFQRFKAMYRDYWYVLVPVHLVTSCFWFGTFFYMAESGVDINALLEMIHLQDSSIGEKIRSGNHTTAGYIAIAYALYKIATPLRYSVTLGGTTISINYLKKWGYIKPIPKKAELKKMLANKRDSFREKRESFRERRAVMKERVIGKITQKEKK